MQQFAAAAGQWAASRPVTPVEIFDGAGAHLHAFAAAVSAAFSAAGPARAAESFAATIERLRDALPGNISGEWYALPGVWAASMLGDERFACAGLGEEFVRSWNRELLELPAIGPSREQIEALKALQLGVLEWQQAGRELDGHYREAVRLGLQRFAAFLRDDDLAPITSLRALYDRWIELAEQAYREIVMTDDFAETFACWVNRAVVVRAALGVLQEQMNDALGLPQRAAVAGLIERVAWLERELGRLREQLEREARPAPEPRAPAASAPRAKAGRVARSSAPVTPARRTGAKRSPPPRESRAVEFDIGDLILKSSD